MLARAARSPAISALGWSYRQTSYVGIDIGVDRVNVASFGIQDATCEDGSSSVSPEWNSRWEFDLPVDPAGPPPSDWVERVARTLADRLPRCVDGDRNVCVISLPLPWIHYQMCEASDLDSIQQQCNEMFAGSLFQCAAHLRHWPVAAGDEQRMVAATAEQAAARIAEVVAGVGYQVEAILPHGVALLHAAGDLTSLRPAAVAILEFTGGLISVTEQPACGLCRSLPSCSMPTGQPHIDELEPWLQEIGSEVAATLRYAGRLGSQINSDAPLLICGSVAEMPGVDLALATFAERPVATWRYAGSVRPTTSLGGTADADSAMSLSLAYSAIEVDELCRHEVVMT